MIDLIKEDVVYNFDKAKMRDAIAATGLDQKAFSLECGYDPAYICRRLSMTTSTARRATVKGIAMTNIVRVLEKYDVDVAGLDDIHRA